MKKTLALICVFAMLFTFCGCRETTVETSVLSYVDGEAVQEGTTGTTVSGETTDKSKDKTTSTTGTANNKGTSDKNDKGSSDKNTAGDKLNNDAGVSGLTDGNKIIDNPLKADLKGATIVIYDTRGIFTADASASKTEKAKAELLAKLQKELNCKLDVKTTDVTKLKSLAATSAASGKAIGGIITSQIYESGYFITSNLAANITRISSIDLTKSYMNRANVLNATQFGNGKYAVAGDASMVNCIFFNKRILGEIGMKDAELYKLVKDGKWTLSKFRSIAKKANKDLDGKPGMSANDQWGLVSRDFETAFTADLLANTNTPMIKLSGGQLKLNMSNANIIKLANLGKEIYDKDGMHYKNSIGKDSVTFFNAGKALFLYANSGDAVALTAMKDEFGLLPVPKVDGSKDYSTALDWNAGVMMVPAGLSAQDQYNAGAVIQAYQYLYDEVIDAKTKEYENRYFCDSESAENFKSGMNYLKANPEMCYAKSNEAILVGTYRVFWNNFSRGTSPASAIESSKVAAQKALDDLNRKIKDKG